MRTDTEIMNEMKAELVSTYGDWRSVDPDTMMPAWSSDRGRVLYQLICNTLHDDTMPKPRDIIAASFGPDKRSAGPWLLSGVIKKN